MKIGIVGGGIAGLYCARALGAKHEVTLFETLDHLGGRIETLNLGGFKAECGPMRFELATQPHFKKLIKGLKIKAEPFPNPRAEPAEYPKFDLAPHEMSTAQMKASAAGLASYAAMFSHQTSALDLLQYGIYRLLHEKSNLTLPQVVEAEAPSKSRIQQYADSFKKEADYNRIRTTASLGRRFLYTLGFWNALARVLSPGALAKVRDTGTFYHLMPENPSASEWSIFWLRLSKSKADLSTIEEGVSAITVRLTAKLKKMKKVQILLNASVSEVSDGSMPGKLSLVVKNSPSGKEEQMQTVDGFDHVIFALPAKPLLSLMEPFPDPVKEQLRGVIPFTLLKAFVVVRDPWWTQKPKAQEGANFLPTREIHYFEFEELSSRRGMVMLYMDRPAVSYWRSFITNPHEKAQVNSTPELKRELARQLGAIWPKQKLNISDQEHREEIEHHIIDFAIRDWSRNPFGAACHAWAPRVDVPDAINSLRAFSLKNTPGLENLHVCGEAYSDYQGFIEGSLRSAENVLNTIEA